MVSDISVHFGAAIADEVKGDAVITNEANVDEDRMRLRRVDIARRVVALRLIDNIISCLFLCWSVSTSHPENLYPSIPEGGDHLCMIQYLSTSKKKYFIGRSPHIGTNILPLDIKSF